MTDTTDTDTTTAAPSAQRPRALRIPSARAGAVLATAMLAAGVAIGAAIGPAPAPSYAEGADGLARRLPQILALIASRDATAATTPVPAATPPPTPAAAPQATAATTTPMPAAASTTTAPAPSAPATGAEEGSSKPAASTGKLPAITNVWLIELDGTSFTEASAQPAAAPYITGTLIAQSTLLKEWPAISAGAFAADAALAEPPAAGATPPLVHSIVQPPCPEGAAGAACAPGSAGALTAADEFLKATLATITTTPAYREHGLVVVTFATVAIATQAGLPAGTSSATLTYQPPAGVALLSPFAKAGASSVAFNPTSPRQSLEKLLR